MIFVTVGSADPFDRLVAASTLLTHIDRVVVQRGRSTVEPAGTEWHDFLPYDRVAELMRDASTVICHAGVGSVLTALLQGTKPIVVPRRHRLGEAVDDHQVPFAERIAAGGLGTMVEDVEMLADLVKRTDVSTSPVAFENALAVDLRAYLVSQGLKPVGAVRG
jgi:UDP-N-acetylglucosamine transferase subunit ALG13